MTNFTHLDTVRHIATPEGCEITIRLAGPVIRSGAWIIDFFIRFAIWIAILIVSGFLGNFGAAVFFVSMFLLEWFYPVLFEVLWHGKTPGKHLLGLAVMHEDGTPVGWNASLVRNTLRFVDFAPTLYAAGFATMLLNRDGKRLGDLAAGTVVAYVENKKLAAPAKGHEGAEPPPFPLTVDEQRALIEFRNRAGSLTADRAAELALAAEPLTRGLLPGGARSRLMRIANYLLGER